MPHPPKKSEIDNLWYAKKRNKRILTAPEKHLILCEGEKTEYNYFNHIKNVINEKYRERITVDVTPTRKGRLVLLEEAEKRVKETKAEHVWLVYDKDDFSESDFDNTVYRIDNLNKEGNVKYHALWSNQCIEVWFLIHFIDLKVDVTRKEYIEKLNQNFNNYGIKGIYKKNDEDIYKKLEPYKNDAIKRMKKVFEEYGNQAPSKTAPASKIYELFDELGAYLE